VTKAQEIIDDMREQLRDAHKAFAIVRQQLERAKNERDQARAEADELRKKVTAMAAAIEVLDKL